MSSKPGISKVFRTRPTIRRSLLRNIVLLILVTGAAIVTVVVVGAYRTVTALSASLIQSATDPGDRVVLMALVAAVGGWGYCLRQAAFRWALGRAVNKCGWLQWGNTTQSGCGRCDPPAAG